MPQESDRLLVFAAGAIGSAFAGFLTLAGEPAVLCGRGAHLAHIRRHGLSLSGIWGEHPRVPLETLFTNEAWSGPPPAAVLVAVQSFDTAAAAADLQRFLGPDTLVVSLQNGLGNCETLAGALGAARIVGGRVIFGARLSQPGHVEITVSADDVVLGPIPGGPAPPRVAALVERVRRSAIPCRTTHRIESYLWAKVLYNAALNPLSALLRCPYGALAEHEETCRLMRRVIDEIYAVAAAESVPMLEPNADAYWRRFLEREVPATVAHRSSMLQAIEAGRRTEIDAISGEVVRRAAHHEIDVPVNAMLADLVRVLERI